MFIARRCQLCSSTVRQMATIHKNHYEVLGVKASATQAEIKTAYYELSKRHHPDTNKGSEDSLAQFRKITNAYEVLGTTSSRKIYDRGLVVGKSGTILRDEVDEDPTARFFRKREKRSEVPMSTGQKTVYDFDAWAKAHYLHSKDRRASARQKYDRVTTANWELKQRRRLDRMCIMACIAFFSILSLYDTFFSKNHDVDQTQNIKKQEEIT